MANNELLDKVMDQIESHRDRWDQGYWRTPEAEVADQDGRPYLPVDCHTSFCFAGWACQLGPQKAVWYNNSLLYADEHDLADDFDRVRWLRDDIEVIWPSYRARRLLGLDHQQAETLFATDMSIWDLKYYVSQIKAGATADETDRNWPGDQTIEED